MTKKCHLIAESDGLTMDRLSSRRLGEIAWGKSLGENRFGKIALGNASMPESSSGFEHEPNKTRKFKFTLSSLFVLTLLVAIFLAVAPFVDLDFLFLAYCAFSLFALANSMRANRGAYYFQFACSLLILWSLLPRLGPYSPSDTQVVVNAGMLGIGMWLSFNAVRHGHWSTKLAAILPLCMLSVFAFYVLKFGVLHADYVVDYWLARD